MKQIFAYSLFTLYLALLWESMTREVFLEGTDYKSITVWDVNTKVPSRELDLTLLASVSTKLPYIFVHVVCRQVQEQITCSNEPNNITFVVVVFTLSLLINHFVRLSRSLVKSFCRHPTQLILFGTQNDMSFLPWPWQNPCKKGIRGHVWFPLG